MTKHVKYPRTYHLPWSIGTSDDKTQKNDDNFLGKEVVVTLKMDGENTTMYNDKIHARSLDSSSHPSRSWVKGLWSKISYMIDDDTRICGENLYAKHSIKYEELPTLFMVFSVWINGTCLSWKETEKYAAVLELHTVPVIFKGEYDKKAIEKAFKAFSDKHEGYVIRIEESFQQQSFSINVGKYVSPKFKQIVNSSHGHWISAKIEPNIVK